MYDRIIAILTRKVFQFANIVQYQSAICHNIIIFNGNANTRL